MMRKEENETFPFARNYFDSLGYFGLSNYRTVWNDNIGWQLTHIAINEGYDIFVQGGKFH